MADVAELDVAELLDAGPAAVATADGRVNLLEVADGAVLTHLFGPEEHQHGVLHGDTDLALWARLARDGIPLASGPGLVRASVTNHTGALSWACVELTGPPGWLAALTPLSIIGLRLRQGRLELESYPRGRVGRGQRLAPEFLASVDQQTTDAFERYLDTRGELCPADPGVPIDELVAQALVTHPGLFDQPLVPVGIALMLFGFDVHHGSAGLPGTPLDDPDTELDDDDLVARVRVASTLLAVQHEADNADDGSPTLDLAQLDRADVDWEQFSDDLTSPPVLQFLADRVEQHAHRPEVFTQVLRQATKPHDRAVALFLTARSEERAGRAERAEALVGQALREDPTLRPALLDAADYATTRGDIPAADAYLRRAGATDHPMRTALARLLTPVPSPAGPPRPAATGPALAALVASTSCAACARRCRRWRRGHRWSMSGSAIGSPGPGASCSLSPCWPWSTRSGPRRSASRSTSPCSPRAGWTAISPTGDRCCAPTSVSCCSRGRRPGSSRMRWRRLARASR